MQVSQELYISEHVSINMHCAYANSSHYGHKGGYWGSKTGHAEYTFIGLNSFSFWFNAVRL